LENVAFAGILQTLEASRKLLRFSYKEEVAGSIGHRPLRKSGICGKNVEDGERVGRGAGPYYTSSTPTQEFSSTKALNEVAFSYRQR
jgi:hypothetical protein